MKEFIQQLYNGLLRFTPIKKQFKMISNQKGFFPLVGFLSIEAKHKLEHNLGVSIHNLAYFEQALIHRSYLQVIQDKGECLSNERLEFLGDSVLGMVAADYLFSLHAHVLEGELTKMRSWLVNAKSLALCARKLELQEFIQMSFSASKSLEAGSEHILSDAMEAIIAAIYLDSGIDVARRFIEHTMFPYMMNKNVMVDKNYKSILLEQVQKDGKTVPRYKVIKEKGPDHDKEFTIGVYIEEKLVARGVGRSKKDAEQLAAKYALGENNDLQETI